MIPRPALLERIQRGLDHNRVVTLIGPRQSGKTTMARQFVAPTSVNYFDLEDPVSLSRLDEPMTALQDLEGLVVIDEIQRRPDLFPVLRVLADRTPLPARFLILGSAAPDLLRQSSESLAGRISLIRMSGLSLAEVGISHQNDHWRRGGFPRAYLAQDEVASFDWRRDFVTMSSNAMYPSSESASLPQACSDSGAPWPITTGRFGTLPRLPERLALARALPAATWICFRICLW